MESAVYNLVEKGDGVVTNVSGFFGQRIKEMIERCGEIPVIVE